MSPATLSIAEMIFIFHQEMSHATKMSHSMTMIMIPETFHAKDVLGISYTESVASIVRVGEADNGRQLGVDVYVHHFSKTPRVQYTGYKKAIIYNFLILEKCSICIIARYK
jgi:hypothetical protein